MKIRLQEYSRQRVREEEKILETCVARVDDVINDMFVIKHFKVEGVKMTVHLSVFCPNVDGRLACATTVGVTQKTPLRWFNYSQRRKSLFVNPSANQSCTSELCVKHTTRVVCMTIIAPWGAWKIVQPFKGMVKSL